MQAPNALEFLTGREAAYHSHMKFWCTLIFPPSPPHSWPQGKYAFFTGSPPSGSTLSLLTYIVRLNLAQRSQKYPRIPRSLGEAGAGSTKKQDSSSSLAIEKHTLIKSLIQRDFALQIFKQAVLKMGMSKNKVKTNQPKKQLILWLGCHLKNFVLMHSSNFRNKLSPSAYALATKMYYYYYFYYYRTETLHSQTGPHYAKHAIMQSKGSCTQFTQVFQL